MTPLRLTGASPAQLREVAVMWWASPLAAALLREIPGLPGVRLRISASGEGNLVGRLLPEEKTPTSWDARVEEASRRLFLAGADALDGDEGFWRAFSPIARPGAETDVLRFTLGDRGRCEHSWLVEPWCADAESPAEVRFKARAHSDLDPDVAEVLEGLEALDQRDALAAAAATLVDALRYARGGSDSVRAKAARLRALLNQLG